ncbi:MULTISPECIES: pirin family protein [unclassified Caballeronia]|jgi:redox-sensitive bicupin YhaK (pirin superfamily)|uniref:pirin family protein n=1 Tax=unclassified Caballeronia TaxID=2646786 RepID=UPI0020277176|nr:MULTISPECIES: pirin family protein [unclassified Caballeronia]MDR5771209.1 pirin family protein [Caballeronia sp. LZ002]MDR5801572.1 pirin family protein [Caballeronia sp. LZ001]MDR5846646.1 pirin family protein [Caballeronia sp. LZ003]
MSRTISSIIPATRTVEGGGFVVHRPFPTRLLMDFDPFLLLDEMGPTDYAPGEAKGAPDHPHRGFETVTYMLEGEFGHKDSAGHSGTLRPGDVQWMTAGAGVIHSEMPGEEFTRRGGRVHGLQLWVNLPKRDKMTTPHYQEIASAQIPVATSEDGKVRVKVIAGEALGVKAAIETRTPILYQHFSLQPGARVEHHVPRDFRVFAYPLSGVGLYGPQGQPVRKQQMISFKDDGDTIILAAGDEPVEVLLIGGVPLKEPVVRYGPFVMNTEDEIRQAVTDYQTGRMGAITH